MANIFFNGFVNNPEEEVFINGVYKKIDAIFFTITEEPTLNLNAGVYSYKDLPIAFSISEEPSVYGNFINTHNPILYSDNTETIYGLFNNIKTPAFTINDHYELDYLNISKVNIQEMFTLDFKSKVVVIKQLAPYRGIKTVTGYKIFSYNSSAYSVEFRWSSDNSNFSSYESDFNNFVSSLPLTVENNTIWVEFRLTFTGNISDKIYISGAELITEQYQDFVYKKCICEASNKFIPPPLPQNMFNPYDVKVALDFQKKMSYTVQNMFGHTGYYYRLEPDQDTKDVVFDEYHSYTEDKSFKCMKILVNNNEFPDSKVTFNPFGMDFESPFEVHIDINYFQTIFGEHKVPQKKDIIFLPIMNRVYQIGSSTLVRDFMQNPLYYSCNLIKYSPSYTNKLKQETQEFLDSITRTPEKVLGEKQKQEREDAANVQQFGQKYRKDDPIRQEISKQQWIEEEIFKIAGVPIFNYYYDNTFNFNKTFPEHKPTIKYKAKVDYTTEDSLCFTNWFNFRQSGFKSIGETALSSESGGIYTFQFNTPLDITKIKQGMWVELKSPLTTFQNLNLYGKVLLVETYKLKVAIPADIVSINNTQYPNWFLQTNFNVYPYSPKIFISNWSVNKGIIFDCLGTRFFRIQLNEKNYLIDIGANTLTYNNWYSLALNISNKFKEINIGIWKSPSKDSRQVKLEKILYKKINLTTTHIWDCESTGEFSLYGSNLFQTNVRLMKTMVNVDQQSKFLTQEYIADASQAIIIDNSAPPNPMPYMGRTSGINS